MVDKKKILLQCAWGKVEALRWYDQARSRTMISLKCPGCSKNYETSLGKLKKKKQPLCYPCYQGSAYQKKVLRLVVSERGNTSGQKNPNWRGGISKKEVTCECGKVFISGNNGRTDEPHYQKYCSHECKARFSVSKVKPILYRRIFFRSSWEVVVAEYFDRLGFTWKYEPKIFKTPFGFYTPDFWVDELGCYVEVKGFWRDDAKAKFEWFEKRNNALLLDMEALLEFGFSLKKRGGHVRLLKPHIGLPTFLA